MGYYTTHSLSIISGDDYKTDYQKEIEEQFNASSFDSQVKWYDCFDDMKKYSNQHPNTIFCIDGEGEESGDIWKAYFKNGKNFHTYGKIIFEDFDESKLK